MAGAFGMFGVPGTIGTMGTPAAIVRPTAGELRQMPPNSAPSYPEAAISAGAGESGTVSSSKTPAAVKCRFSRRELQ